MSAGKPTITAILPRGEAIRNFVYSGCLDEVQRHAALDVVSVLPNEQIRGQLESRYGGIEELVAVRERYPVRLARDILDMAHGRRLDSVAARHRWKRHDELAALRGASGRRAVKKALARCFATNAGLSLLSCGERIASRVLAVGDHYKRRYQRVAPDLVFNGSHVHSVVATPAVQAAQWLGIKTATFLFSWDNLTSQGRIMLPYDAFLVWNDEIRDDLLRIYPDLDAEQVFVTGTPQFDPHFDESLRWSRRAFCERLGLDAERPVVLYTTAMPNHTPDEEVLVEGIADVVRSLDAQLIVRVYAKDRSGRFDALRERRRDIVFSETLWEPHWLTPLPEDTALWSNLLAHADVGINVASTVSLELCMFDKPVLNVAYNPPAIDPAEHDYAHFYEFDHYARIVESGAVALVREADGMHAALAEALEHPQRRSERRQALLASFFADTLDGASGRRVASVLAELAATASG